MNKIITINLGGIAIQIEEDAYDVLRGYLKRLETHFRGTENADEILSDIEHRIAEMLFERLKSGKVSINKQDVEEVSEAMGSPDDLEADDTTESGNSHSGASSGGGRKRIKRLFRDPDDGKIGGVCYGLAKYLDIDVAIVRIIWLVMIFVFGTGFLIYFLLWAILPEAKTAAEKLEMAGEVPNVENITNAVRDEASSAYQRIKSSSAGDKVNSFFDKLLSLFVALIKVFAKVVGVVFTIILFIAILGFFFRFFSVGSWFDFGRNFHFDWEDISTGLLGTGPYWIIKISWFLFAVIPLMYILVRLVTMMLGVPKPSKLVRQGVLSVWLLTILTGIGGMIWGASQLREEVKTSSHEEIALSSDTLMIRLDDLDNEDLFETKRRITLDVVQSSDDQCRLAIAKRSRGSSETNAEAGLKGIIADYNYSNNVLGLNEFILLEARNSAKLPELRYTLEIPTGKYVTFNQNTAKVIDDIKNQQNIYDRQMAGKTFVMLPAGLSCTNCEGSSYNKRYMNFNHQPIREIEISDALRIEIIEGNRNEIIYPKDKKWQEAVEMKFENNVLKIEQEDDFESLLNWISDDSDRKITIYTSDLERLELEGSSIVNFQADQGNSREYFELDVSGANNIHISNLNAFKASAEAAGTNKININGKTKIFMLELDGASSVEAMDFVAESINVDIDGAAVCDIHATREITGKVDGAGKVNYWGNPDISVKSRGLSSVNNRN